MVHATGVVARRRALPTAEPGRRFRVVCGRHLGHGSGFFAVFVAGIALGDERAPYKLEIERFHGALASLGEIVAFAVLGSRWTCPSWPTSTCGSQD